MKWRGGTTKIHKTAINQHVYFNCGLITFEEMPMSSPLRNINDSLVTVSPVFLDTLQVWRIIELEGGRSVVAAAPDTAPVLGSHSVSTQQRSSATGGCGAAQRPAAMQQLSYVKARHAH